MEAKEEGGKPSRGAIWIATGPKFIMAAAKCALSLREHSGQDFPTHIFTDNIELAKSSGAFTSFTLIENPHRRSKVDYVGLTPFDQTIYLDADTRVVADLREVFTILDRFDIAMTHAHRRAHNPPRLWRIPLPGSFPQLNSGVIVYKKSENVLRFFEEWKTAFHEAKLPKDQTTLRELLWLHAEDVKVYVLPPEYNCRYESHIAAWASHFKQNEAIPKVLHMTKFVDEAAAELAKN